MGKRIGIIGGSFDPIHLGHLIIAQDACEQFELDLALFLPAYQAPLKTRESTASAAQRMDMTRLAVTSEPQFGTSEVDFEHKDASYSVRAARRLHEQHPDDTLLWILGADQIELLHQWHKIEELAELVSFIGFERPGFSSDLSNLPGNVRINLAQSRILEISSTEIRKRIKNGTSAKYFLPAPVLDYIKANNLYMPQPKMGLATNEKATR